MVNQEISASLLAFIVHLYVDTFIVHYKWNFR